MITREQLPHIWVRDNLATRMREYYDARTGEVLLALTDEMLERCPNVSAEYIERHFVSEQ
jgi:hypothetical protein